jgi:salicylate hydroxylase
MPGRRISVAVVGGGIGGLSAAASLLQAGFDVDVYEQASELSEVGAGIQVSPNASRILHGLGLADELASMGVRPLAWHQRRWDDGRTLLRTSLGKTIVDAFGYPHYQTHRADLLAALLGTIPPHRVHPGHRFVSFRPLGDRVEAEFANGERIRADVLVGADGIHSAVREALFGPLLPHFTGCAAYRGLVPADLLRGLELEVASTLYMGPGGHFIHYFVQSERLVNFVAIVDRDSWTRESWTDRGDLDEALAAFEGWHPQVRSILGAVDEVFIWALFDRPPLERWNRGRVTLLGDACHAMLPFMAQGAAQAIEDGAALAACLTHLADVDVGEALELYERVRRPRATRLQELSAANKVRFHLPDGPDQEARDEEMSHGSTDWSINAVAWLYGHDARVLDSI